MSPIIQIPELLAPAGNLNTALAAFDAGADAVYAGLKHFNARERGDNFTDDEMGHLISYAHKNGRKVYITFNTVVKESEIPAAAEALAGLEYLRPDALIVQDIGVVRMIREFFPNLRIHGSTQMALHDSKALETAKSMGISRVILERQVTLDELRIIAENAPLEIEVFVHGALCCCLSGTCLFSSWLGGASGNRGQCKQPCRRQFKSETGRSGFYFSTKDMAAFSLIREFKQLGIASLKIEGRLRKADYVAAVTHAYRTVLDAPDDRFDEACRNAAEALTETATREPSLGFYTDRSAETLIRPDSSGAIGKETGRVIRTGKDFFEAELNARIHVGDALRVQSPGGDEGKTFTLLDLSVNGKKVLKAFPGDRCLIRGSDKEIFADGILYKVGESSGSMEKRIDNLPPHKPAVDFSVKVNKDGFSAKYGNYTWQFSVSLAAAKTHGLDGIHLAEGFSAPGESRLSAGRISAETTGNLFVPNSILKEAKKDFWHWLDNLAAPSILRAQAREKVQRFLTFYDQIKPCTAASGKTILDQSPESEFVLPFFTPETELSALQKEIEKRIADGQKIFRVTSISHFAFLKKYPGLNLKIMPPLPVANSFAVLEAQALGASSAVIHIELDKKEIQLLIAKSVLPLEMYCYGRPVILATRAKVTPMDSFSELHGERFLIRKYGVLTLILPETPVSLPVLPGVIELIDLRETPSGSAKTSMFNFERGLK